MKPPTRLSEVELFQGLRNGDIEWTHAETRPCACGQPIIGNPANPAPAVAEHRETPRHRAWAEEWLS